MDQVSACPEAADEELPDEVVVVIEEPIANILAQTTHGGVTAAQREICRQKRERALFRRAERERKGVPEGADETRESAQLQRAEGARRGGRHLAEERAVCVICQYNITPVEATMVLKCGHEFHEHCVRKYVESQRIDIKDACPMRCHRSTAEMDELERLAELELEVNGRLPASRDGYVAS
jgi:hypothetical protein